MTASIAAAVVLIAGLLPLVWTAWHHAPMVVVIASELAVIFVVLLMLFLSEVYADMSSADLAVVLATLSVGSGLVFVPFLERWI